MPLFSVSLEIVRHAHAYVDADSINEARAAVLADYDRDRGGWDFSPPCVNAFPIEVVGWPRDDVLVTSVDDWMTSASYSAWTDQPPPEEGS